jgi:hypothetical protein
VPGTASLGREERSCAHGLTLAELVRPVTHPLRRSIAAPMLRRWLLAEELTVEVDGELRPTSRCVELSEALSASP